MKQLHIINILLNLHSGSSSEFKWKRRRRNTINQFSLYILLKLKITFEFSNAEFSPKSSLLSAKAVSSSDLRKFWVKLLGFVNPFSDDWGQFYHLLAVILMRKSLVSSAGTFLREKKSFERDSAPVTCYWCRVNHNARIIEFYTYLSTSSNEIPATASFVLNSCNF